jgi:hypothetical protein
MSKSRHPAGLLTREPTNTDKAKLVSLAVKTYADCTGLEDSDEQTKVSDLVADLKHYCDWKGVSWLEVTNRAYWHYGEEIRERPKARPRKSRAEH